MYTFGYYNDAGLFFEEETFYTIEEACEKLDSLIKTTIDKDTEICFESATNSIVFDKLSEMELIKKTDNFYEAKYYERRESKGYLYNTISDRKLKCTFFVKKIDKPIDELCYSIKIANSFCQDSTKSVEDNLINELKFKFEKGLKLNESPVQEFSRHSERVISSFEKDLATELRKRRGKRVSKKRT